MELEGRDGKIFVLTLAHLDRAGRRARGTTSSTLTSRISGGSTRSLIFIMRGSYRAYKCTRSTTVSYMKEEERRGWSWGVPPLSNLGPLCVANAYLFFSDSWLLSSYSTLVVREAPGPMVADSRGSPGGRSHINVRAKAKTPSKQEPEVSYRLGKHSLLKV